MKKSNLKTGDWETHDWKTGVLKRGTDSRSRWQKGWEAAALLFLLLYPMRHIGWGLDLWDTGYNYANFQYMGLEHMDPMWLYSTYLANVVGHFLTLLPFGGTLKGMNFYTGLFVSALAAGGYLFATRRLRIPGWIAFLGELAAVSMCWCPTAKLYDYLTYLLLTACVILLYEGLTKEKKGCLYAAGVCLGSNVLTRFSNLPEAGLIVAVWAYGVMEWLEDRRKGAERNDDKGTGKSIGRDAGEKARKSIGKDAGETLRRTLWCLGGYLSALLVFLGYIHLRYGIGSYIEGIRRLLGMTDNAQDYTAASMLYGMFYEYVDHLLYWGLRILFIAAAGVVLFGAAEWIAERGGKAPGGLGAERGAKRRRTLRTALCILWCAVAVAMVVWLYARGFCSLILYTYGPMYRPGVLFLLLTMGIAAVCVLHPRSPREEKLLGVLVAVTLLLTSIGSNNKLYPSLNNLFLAAPYTLWESWRFVRGARDCRRYGITVCPFPAKAILCAFLALFLVQSFLFGTCFVFAEATGVQNVTAKVENNEVLKGIRMDPERAEWMRSVSAYVEEQGLAGSDAILYDGLRNGRPKGIPALSYYLQLPAAFNPWSELPSYSLEAMRQAMEETRARMEEDAGYRPVILLEERCARYMERFSGEGVPEEGLTERDAETLSEELSELDGDPKWQLIVDLMREYGYEQTFRNEKFGIWESAR